MNDSLESPDPAPEVRPPNSARGASWFSPGRMVLLVILAAAFYGAWSFRQRSLDRWHRATLVNLQAAVKYQEFSEAVKLARELIEYDPDQIDVALQGAGAAVESQDLEAALQFLQVATRKPHDKLAQVYAQIGFIYAEKSDLDKAEAYWLKSVETDPNFSQSLRQLCYIYSLESRRWESLPFHFQLVRMGDFVFDDLFFLGNQRVAIAEVDQLNRLMEQNPDYKMVHFGLGRIALSMTDTEAAIEHF